MGPFWEKLLEFLFTGTPYRIFELVGVAFILLGVVGRYRAYFRLEARTRVIAGVLGFLFLIGALWADSMTRFRVESATIFASYDKRSEAKCPVTVPLEVQVATNGRGRVVYEISLRGQRDLGDFQEIDDRRAGNKVTNWPVERSVSDVVPELRFTAPPRAPKLIMGEPIRVACVDVVSSQAPPPPQVQARTDQFKRMDEGPVDHPGAAPQINAGRVVLSRDFDKLGLKIEGYRDNRPSNPNHGEESMQALARIGGTTIINGSTKDSGVTYTAPTGFPYIQFDQKGGRILLHPGTFGTSQTGASLGFTVTEKGQYLIKGAFQRANDLLGQGDGVDVAVIVDADAASPLWAGHIDSRDHNKMYFSIKRQLLSGQVIRFVVFSGPQGLDGTFDATSLEATIDW